MTVATPAGISAVSGADQFTYVTPPPPPPPAPPAVTGVSPASGPVTGGTTVTITGTGFTGAFTVSFRSPAPSFTVDSDTQITATSPAGAGAGPADVTVATPAGISAASSADQFTYMFTYDAEIQPGLISPQGVFTGVQVLFRISGTQPTGKVVANFQAPYGDPIPGPPVVPGNTPGFPGDWTGTATFHYDVDLLAQQGWSADYSFSPRQDGITMTFTGKSGEDIGFILASSSPPPPEGRPAGDGEGNFAPGFPIPILGGGGNPP